MNLVNMNTISEIKNRERYLPLEMRMQMYNDVHRLHKEGLTYKEIQRRIYEKYGKRLCIRNISDWINKKCNPFGKLNKFDDKPSSELSYIIGVKLSDGYICFSNNKHRIELSANDYEFTEEFAKCLTKVLKRRKPYKPFWNKSKKQWTLSVCSFLVYKFLDRPLEELKPYIEYSRKCVSAFLRALFDGEGTIYKRILLLHNTHEELLNYAKHLLKQYFNIDSTKPYLKTKSGEGTHLLNGRIIKRNKDCYCLYVRAKSLLNFYKYIGFTIKRKQQRLINAIKQ